jgi:hypothetical protein
MAITLIRKKQDSSWANLMFQTKQEIAEKENGEEGARPMLLGTVTIVDDNLQKKSDPIPVEISSSEEEFHVKLRIEAAKRNQLITSHSTDPEWNPEGYTKNLK